MMRSIRTAWTAIGRAPGFVIKTLKRRLVDRYYSHSFSRNLDHRALSRRAASEVARDAETILFLCWGNICRSPFAERYLRARLDEQGVTGVTIQSAGWGEYEGRESPADAVASAEQFGVDLADHQSRRLSAEIVRRSDVVLVMDYNDFHALSSRYPEASTEVFFLRAFLDDVGPNPRIADPHGRGRTRFDRTYDEIARAIDAMVSVIRADGPHDPAGTA